MNETTKKAILFECKNFSEVKRFLRDYATRFTLPHNRHEAIAFREMSTQVGGSVMRIETAMRNDKEIVKAEPGPWVYGSHMRGHGESNVLKHFVESQGPSGEDYDDVRLYIDGNMTDEMYEAYGKRLADQLNGKLKED